MTCSLRLFLSLSAAAFAGCATGPTAVETEREVVLQHIGGEAGTAGPFGRKAKQELAILAESDRAQAAALLERGAAAYLVYPRTSGPAPAANATRVVLVQHGHVVGDFRAP